MKNLKKTFHLKLRKHSKKSDQFPKGVRFVRATAPKSEQTYRKTGIIAGVDAKGCLKGCYIEQCKWDIDDADLFIGVKDALFPVHRSFISLASPILRGIIVTVGQLDEAASVIRIGGYTTLAIKLLLNSIYFPTKPLQGK